MLLCCLPDIPAQMCSLPPQKYGTRPEPRRITHAQPSKDVVRADLRVVAKARAVAQRAVAQRAIAQRAQQSTNLELHYYTSRLVRQHAIANTAVHPSPAGVKGPQRSGLAIATDHCFGLCAV